MWGNPNQLDSGDADVGTWKIAASDYAEGTKQYIICKPLPITKADGTQIEKYVLTLTVSPGTDYKVTEIRIPNKSDQKKVYTAAYGKELAPLAATIDEDALGKDIEIDMVSKNTPDYSATKLIRLLPAEILTDYNRDGKINDKDRGKVTAAKPWRWWINDDKDTLGALADPEANTPGQQNGNATDGVVNGSGDLTDFFPLFLDLKAMIEFFPPEEYKYKLKQADGAMSFAEALELKPDGDPDSDAAGAYWRSDLWAEEYSKLKVTQVTAAGIELSNTTLLKLKEGKGIFLMEYRAQSSAPLVLEVSENGTKLCTVPFDSKGADVEKMYRHVNLFSVTQGQNNLLHRMNEPENLPDDETNDKAFVMVHGFSPRDTGKKNDNAQRSFQKRVFTRMLHSKNRSKYVAVYWDSATKKDYHKAVYHAFKTSAALKGSLKFLVDQGLEVTVAGHSLGNIVISNAISHHGFRPKNYFLINATVPLEAYIPSQTKDRDGKVMKPAMTEKYWKSYNERFYCANWWMNFPASDNRNKLKWKGRFEKVHTHTKMVNFYSSGEDVVANPVSDKISVAESVWKPLIMGQPLKRYSWASQEFIKGGTTVLAAFFDKNHGGWQHIGLTGNTLAHRMMGYIGPNTPLGKYDLYFPATSNTRLTNGSYNNEHLAQFGIFKRFESPKYDKLYAPINDANKSRTGADQAVWNNPHTQAQGHQLAGKNDTQWQLLASAIPTLSFAVAANELTGIKAIDNFDMMNLKQNGWPDNLGREPEYKNDWQHSDFVDIKSVLYVVKMYNQMVKEGKLDEIQ